MAERDAILQLNRNEATLILRSLQMSQDLLLMTADQVPTAGIVVEERLQHLSRVRQMMLKVRDAPAVSNFYPPAMGGVCLVNAQTLEFETWSGALENLLGYTEDDALGQHAGRLLGVSSTQSEQLAERIRQESEHQFALPLRGKSGVTLHCMVFAQMAYLRCEKRDPSEHILVHFWLT